MSKLPLGINISFRKLKSALQIDNREKLGILDKPPLSSELLPTTTETETKKMDFPWSHPKESCFCGTARDQTPQLSQNGAAN